MTIVPSLNGELTAAAATFAAASVSPATQIAYTTDWSHFTTWCEQHHSVPLPADPISVANFIADQAATYRPATLNRRVAAINKIHQMRGLPPPGVHPAVRTVIAGVRRTASTRPHRMRPLLTDDIRRIIDHITTTHWPEAVAGLRDQCLLVFGFAGAMRRSELGSLQLTDATWHAEDGLHLRLGRSKTDQEGEGLVKALPFGRTPQMCPACALHRWLDILTSPDRPTKLGLIMSPTGGHVCRQPHPALGIAPQQWLFPPIDRHGHISPDRHMSGQAINDMVRRRAAAAGFGAGYGSHSMRAGFVTQALRAGASDAQVMRQTGHRSPATVHIYDREYNPLKGNAVTKLGL